MLGKANSCLFGVATVALLLGVAGCSPTEPTQIVAGMVTQMRVPEEIQSVGLVVQSEGKPVFCNNYQVDDETHSVTLPSTFAASSQGDVTKPLTVTVLGFPQFDPEFENNCFIERTVASGPLAPKVMRRRRSTFVLNELLYMPMPLRHSCAGVQCDKDNETCVGGKCQPLVDINSQVLGKYDEELVYGRTSMCFDANLCANFSPFTVPAFLKDRQTCEFRVPISEETMKSLPKGAEINVSIVHDNFTWEVLDQDDQEGFYFKPDGDKLTQFYLAKGLCEERYSQGKMLDVMVNVGCSSKPALQPICASNQKDIMGGRLGPPSVVNQPPLVGGSKLESVDSAILLLLDDVKKREDIQKYEKNKAESPEWVRELFETLDNPLMSNLYIGIAVSSDITMPSKIGEFLRAYDKEKQSAEGLIEGLLRESASWPRPNPIDTPSWFDGDKVIGALKDRFAGHNTIVVITDRSSPIGLCSKQGTCETIVDSMDEFCRTASKTAGSIVHVLNTKGSAGEYKDCKSQYVESDAALGTKLWEILRDSASCKYKKPDGFKPDSVISYLKDIDKTRGQIAPCQAGDGESCHGWKETKSEVGGGVSYIEVLGEENCGALHQSLDFVTVRAKAMGGKIPEAPLYISSK